MKWLFFLLPFVLIGCGYKPSSIYVKKVLGDNIHVSVSISRQDPKNSVIIKDAVNEAVVGRFGAKLASKAKADSNLLVSIGSVSFLPTSYNKDGYIISYKATVTLNASYKTIKRKSQNFTTIGEYSFPIEANSVISDTARFNAIKFASMDAINEIVSKISITGIMSGDDRKNIKTHLH